MTRSPWLPGPPTPWPIPAPCPNAQHRGSPDHESQERNATPKVSLDHGVGHGMALIIQNGPPPVEVRATTILAVPVQSELTSRG